MKRTFFITGTDTGVGKTVLTALLVEFLRAHGVNAAGLKPVCSGGRGDARKIFAAMNGGSAHGQTLSLDEINPWHFRVPVAPVLAARRENRKIHLSQVVVHIRAVQQRFDVVLVEGAGGLLSPLGEGFHSRDLIVALRAAPLVVAPNRLGVLNHVRLTLEVLPENFRRKTKVVLMSPLKPDGSTRANAGLLAEFFDVRRIFTLPWLGENFPGGGVLKTPRVRQTLRALTAP